MANTRIQIKRTTVSGRAANTTTLTNAGELAINLADAIMYSTNGTSVFEIGANTTNSQVSNTLTVSKVSANGSVGTATQVLSSNSTGTYWASAAPANVALSYAWTNTHSFSNTVTIARITANGTSGTAGQVLTSNGTSTYWSTVSGGGGSVDVNAAYAWTNTHSFSNTVTINKITATSVGVTNELLMSNSTSGAFWGTALTIGTTAPTSPSLNDLWVDIT